MKSVVTKVNATVGIPGLGRVGGAGGAESELTPVPSGVSSP